MRKIFEVNTDKILNTPFLYERAKEYKKLADENIGKDIACIPFSGLKAFGEKGERKPFEKYYHIRRKLLTAYAVSALVFGDDKYIEKLEDYIWTICDESSWALSAHYDALDTDKLALEKHRKTIDLCVSQTALTLSEIYVFLGDKLHNVVKERIRHELCDRVIDSFINKECYFAWEERQINNWCSVCAAGVGAAILYMAGKDEIALAMPRLIKIMDRYLESFRDDGICLEGYGYWNYGFFQFVILSQLIYHYTDGDIDLMNSKKVDNIAHFQQKAFICENKVVSFSDADRECNYLLGLSHFLYNRFKDIKLPHLKYAEGSNTYFHNALRDFMWYDDTITDYGLDDEAFYPEPVAGWYIKKNKNFAFAAKGGHNNEPHNHNDIGNFIVFKNNKEVVCDLGSGQYTKTYFSPNRYSVFCNSSLSHNVPIIDGAVQVKGEEHKAEILEMSESVFKLELKGAYEIDALTSFNRRFDVSEGKVVLTDTFSFCDNKSHSICERFVTLTRPVITNKGVLIADGILKCENNGTWKISEHIHQRHDTKVETVYTLDFVSDVCDNVYKFTFE